MSHTTCRRSSLCALLVLSGLLAGPGVLSSPAADAPARPQAVVIEGYPAFEAPIFSYLMRHRGVKVRNVERVWLPTEEYAAYSVVVVTGDLARAKVQPTVYSPDDLRNVKAFLEKGGTLLLTRGNAALFSSPEGQLFLQETMGTAPKVSKDVRNDVTIVRKDHPWVRHLDPNRARPWLNENASGRLPAGKAERILGTPSGHAILARAPLGKGQIIYIGWDIARSLPEGRRPSTAEDERTYDEQARILTAIFDGLFPKPQGGQ